jgi:osmoprotectant transport system ATP-binding protein
MELKSFPGTSPFNGTIAPKPPSIVSISRNALCTLDFSHARLTIQLQIKFEIRLDAQDDPLHIMRFQTSRSSGPHPLDWNARSRRMSAAIEFRNVSFAISRERLLLDNISLTLEEGTTTAVLGRSGSGKTTLLRTVNRMVEPTSGDVFVHGKNLREENLITLRRSMGYVIQETGLFPHFTVERNVGVVLEAEGRPREQRARRSRELLQVVGLDPAGFSQRYPHQLSGGQRQRVGLARALAAEPGILLMDEPFGALDPLTRGEMQDMLLALMNKLKKTVLLVTHDLDEALYLAHRIVLLGTGKLIANLSPAEFLRSNNPEVVAYVKAFHRGSQSAAGTEQP